jgi:catechol 2,3-dioxygenase-like lactoylglutathione lyase family enzyme
VHPEWGGASFRWKDDDLDGNATTAWSIFAADSTYFPNPFMINFRVKNLDRMLEQLRAAGATVDPKVDDSEFGRFGWAMDPEGNRFELWEPRAEHGAPAPTPPVKGPEETVEFRPAPKKPKAKAKAKAKKKSPAKKAKNRSRK